MSEMKEIEESILTDSTEVASPLEQRTEVTSSIKQLTVSIHQRKVGREKIRKSIEIANLHV